MRIHVVTEKWEYVVPEGPIRVSEFVKAKSGVCKVNEITHIEKCTYIYKGPAYCIVLYDESENDLTSSIFSIYICSVSSLLSLDTINALGANKENAILKELTIGLFNLLKKRLQYYEEVNVRLSAIPQVFMEEKIKVLPIIR